ncbi:guanine nucleotide exchange factor still life [Brevipalpus obovatus]|uniref:guanine nucleotide exchange factor still life n=1 Tax=Brevipalpus obovatus TaxID=246614 RepID=UPI003D9F51EC
MGNKLSCSCTPQAKKGYQYEEQQSSSFQQQRRADGHLLRLWAEVFHVSAASGAIRWQQVTSDLVPVHLTCIQDSPECIFQVTAYTANVQKILDTKIIQPGTRLGQASECFIYWKDTSTGDTWGLNFTSPDDAKQFRYLCSPAFRISRKASSSYSLRLNEPSSKRTAPDRTTSATGKRKPQSTPSSPSRRGYDGGELQCTCMTVDNLHRQRNGRVRYTGTSTMPKSAFRGDMASYPSTASVHATTMATVGSRAGMHPMASRVQASNQMASAQHHATAHQKAAMAQASGAPRSQGGGGGLANGNTSVPKGHQMMAQHSRNAQYSRAHYAQSARREQSRSMDCPGYSFQNDRTSASVAAHQRPMVASGHPHYQSHHQIAMHPSHQQHAAMAHYPQAAMYQRSSEMLHRQRYGPAIGASTVSDAKSRSKSSDDVRRTVATGTDDLQLDSNTLKKMLHPLAGSTKDTTDTGNRHTSTTGVNTLITSTSSIPSISSSARREMLRNLHRSTWSYSQDSRHSEPAMDRSMVSSYRSEVSRRRSLERTQCVDYTDQSPPPDHYFSDSAAMAAGGRRATTPTPSSSGDEGLAGRARSEGEMGLSGLSGLGGMGGMRGSEQSVRRLLAKVDAVQRGDKRPSSPTIKLLQEYEQHLRNALAKGADADTYSLNTFETILSQSMENVVSLMREVQSELDAIRREEQQYRGNEDNIQHHFIRHPLSSSQYHLPSHHHSTAYPHHNSATSINFPTGAASASSLHSATLASGHHLGSSNLSRKGHHHSWNRSYTLPSRGTSLPPPTMQGSSTSDLCSSHLRKSSAPILDTLSIDSGLFSTGLHPQASFESNDSKAYLTSSEMSDDERLSLTTAISDDDDGDRDSPYRLKRSSAAAQFQCTGANRKSGFLSVKKWIIRKRHTIELARKRGWKGYWVELKGTMLLFYPCDTRDGRAIESKPRHLIIIDGSIMQPIPEHPKRDFVFCLSTTFGDAYLFQAPCQEELELWISAIHNACGSAFARHRGKTGTLHLLQEDIHRISQQIESESKSRHLAEREITDHIVTDPEARKIVYDRLRKCDENLEQYHCEIFRLRCYIASIQITELPNPKTLLAHVSKPTKAILNRLGVFTVSSLHAFICARSPNALSNLVSVRSNSARRRGVSSSMPSSSTMMSVSTKSLSRHSSVSSKLGNPNLSRSAELPNDKIVKIMLPPDDQIHSIYVRGTETIEELLWMVCPEKQLDASEFYIRCRRMNNEYYVPSRHDVLDNLMPFEVMQVCPKITYQIHLSRASTDQLFGFSVEAELVESPMDQGNQDELSVYVSRVEEGSIAFQQGLKKGDEILIINGSRVADLDMMFIESVLQEELSLGMTILSCRSEPPETATSATGIRTDDDFIESLVCPPPPSDSHLSDEMIGKLIVPSPLWVQERSRSNSIPSGGGQTTLTTIAPPPNTCLPLQVSGEQIAETLLKNAEQVTTEYCKSPVPGAVGGPTVSTSPVPMAQTSPQARSSTTTQIHTSQLQYHKAPMIGGATVSASSMGGLTVSGGMAYDQGMDMEGQSSVRRASPLSDAEKMRKVIRELVDTERTYVKHLNNLLEIYLEPMKRKNLLSESELALLFGNIQDIVTFQRQFSESLDEALRIEENFDKYCASAQFRNLLFSIGNSFLFYADKFKLYSSFCASHSKAQKILHPTSEAAHNPALVEFLHEASKGQHANSLESHLIKPIQRILKYPLLLNQLKSLTDPLSDEHKHLTQALKGMERVAEHINEMQRIHEEYGAIFDHLQRQHYKSQRGNIELSPAELLHYGGVDWTNISEFLGKIKKGLDLHPMCFVFKSAVVFLCKEKIRQKKKLVGVTTKASEVEIIRYQVLIPVTEVQVRATSVRTKISPVQQETSVSNGSQYLWELIHLRGSQLGASTQRRIEKVYQLSNSTNEFRNAFLRTIRQIIRESVQKMPLPSTKPQSMLKSSPSPDNDSFPVPPQAPPLTKEIKRTSFSASRHNESQQELDKPRADSLTNEAKTLPKASGSKSGVKQKPLPPPRAPTTTKTSGTGPIIAQQSAFKPKNDRDNDDAQNKQQNVSCALCGADVGPGTGDHNEHTSNEGHVNLCSIGNRKGSSHDGKILEKQKSTNEPDS